MASSSLVRKKDATQCDVIELGDGPHYIQDSGVLEKQCTVSGDKLLTIREVGEDSGHKRKNGEDLCSHNDNAIHTGSPSKSKKKRKHSDEILGSKILLAEKTIRGDAYESHENGSMTQSRTARRKKAKRQWLRKQKSQLGENAHGQTPPNVIHGESPGQQQETDQQKTEQSTEVEKEIVPVVIRPGHIRSQSSDEVQSQGQSLEAMETLQWNGTTSKKKGQKWGRERTLSNWNDANGYKEQSNGKERTMSKWSDANSNKGQKWGREKVASKWNDANGYKGQEWPREKAMSKGNDANLYNEQYSGKEKTLNKWNEANGSTKE